MNLLYRVGLQCFVIQANNIKIDSTWIYFIVKNESFVSKSFFYL